MKRNTSTSGLVAYCMIFLTNTPTQMLLLLLFHYFPTNCAPGTQPFDKTGDLINHPIAPSRHLWCLSCVTRRNNSKRDQ
ncbi:hypothetical protein J3E72DRAFT_438895, partial [Bipolaris maydis]